MAFKKRFTFHIDRQFLTNDTANTIIKNYISEGAESPTGWYQLIPPDRISFEINVTNSKDIPLIEAKLLTLLRKVTARLVIISTETGPTLPGSTSPGPETDVGFKFPGGKNTLDILQDIFQKGQFLIFIGALIFIVIVAFRISR